MRDPAGSTVTRPEPGLRRVLAPNPSPMTYHGTNTYILGEGAVAVIDPGPALPRHLDAILSVLEPGERVSHILITHSHLDHSPLSRPLSEATGAPILGFGTHEDGRSDVMKQLAARREIGGGEGIDTAFQPDQKITDGATIEGDGWRLDALWTPGHIANHLCFAWGNAVFTGDHVMGWASSLISPPDGDLAAFMRSCDRLSKRSDRIYYPGHGDPVPDPGNRLSWLVAHRREREAQILTLLSEGPTTLRDLTAQIYTGTHAALLPAAERNMLAHIIDLSEKRIVSHTGLPGGLLSLRPSGTAPSKKLTKQ
ncbi:MBL fold metallo-hydrolase [Tropicimonas sp. TH_r6]|uniref:MBL fold metallo-hydrolase n=1 Tax=Tropicimonas sp. TH_r6 TaxID=3082085 RepID=UPI002953097C|nr:MBL fold metallo-hydrolase [Tropicimonas sp. TH_r6]MDV7144376.1 MBL fold metallo-hydrolase [Tropicimonas sp. TH_r6]